MGNQGGREGKGNEKSRGKGGEGNSIHSLSNIYISRNNMAKTIVVTIHTTNI